MNLNNPISVLPTVGKTTISRFKKLGINTINDLLFHFPHRYEDYSKITKISDLRTNEIVHVIGTVALIQSKKSPRRKMAITEALIYDDSGEIRITWFNQAFITRTIKTGDQISLTGKIDNDYIGLIMKSPNYEKVNSNQNIHTNGIVPIYSSSAGLTQKQIRFLVNESIKLADKVPEFLPKNLTEELKLIPIYKAIKKIHFPKNSRDLTEAKKRLAFEELLYLQLQVQYIQKINSEKKSPQIKFYEKETKDFVDSLPFKLTNSQKISSWEIIKDIKKNTPAFRLLEGDVGSGKTIVAAITMMNVAEDKRQSVLMAPTEILAWQHYKSFKEIFGYKENPLEIALLTGSQQILNSSEKISKKKLQEKIKEGSVDIIIGTHALFSKNVKYKNLSLIVVDEQHRFGVEQRKKLIDKSGLKNKIPHFLSMTATPIPRSLALAIYGQLLISRLKEKPKGRKIIKTYSIDSKRRNETYRFIREKIRNKEQVFVICPLVDISEKTEVKSVEEEYKKIKNIIFPEFKTAKVHGQMKSKEKEQIMKDFRDKKYDILVATAVVEVGVDIPGATTMIIEGADRFGLAQLHQFRGRIGRSDKQSYCFLFSDSNNPRTKERLSYLNKYSDGFSLAKIDLKFRGPGEVYGTLQKGFPELKVASLFDYKLMNLAKEWANRLLEEDPELKKLVNIKEKLVDLESKIHLE